MFKTRRRIKKRCPTSYMVPIFKSHPPSMMMPCKHFYDALSPFYIIVLPINDQWDNNFMAYCGIACDGNYGISGAAGDDFVIASYARAGVLEAFSFDPNDPEAGLFVVSKAAHFDRDLVMWNGSWIRAPRTAATGT